MLNSWHEFSHQKHFHCWSKFVCRLKRKPFHLSYEQKIKEHGTYCSDFWNKKKRWGCTHLKCHYSIFLLNLAVFLSTAASNNPVSDITMLLMLLISPFWPVSNTCWWTQEIRLSSSAWLFQAFISMKGKMPVLYSFISNLAAIQVFTSESAVLYKPKNFIESLDWTDTLFFCACS